MVSLGLIYGFFRLHLGFDVGVPYQGFLSGILWRLAFLWVSPRVFKVSFRIQTGVNKANEKKKQGGSKDRMQISRGAGGRAAKTT